MIFVYAYISTGLEGSFASMHDKDMNQFKGVLAAGLLLAAGAIPAFGVELRVSRDALERTLKAQLFNGPSGRYYLKGTPRAPARSTPRIRG